MSESEVILQGIVDLLVREDENNAFIVDYKTDNVVGKDGKNTTLEELYKLTDEFGLGLYASGVRVIKLEDKDEFASALFVDEESQIMMLTNKATVFARN